MLTLLILSVFNSFRITNHIEKSKDLAFEEKREEIRPTPLDERMLGLKSLLYSLHLLTATHEEDR